MLSAPVRASALRPAGGLGRAGRLHDSAERVRFAGLQIAADANLAALGERIAINMYASRGRSALDRELGGGARRRVHDGRTAACPTHQRHSPPRPPHCTAISTETPEAIISWPADDGAAASRCSADLSRSCCAGVPASRCTYRPSTVLPDTAYSSHTCRLGPTAVR
jgi:hypothetical protein